MKTNILDINGNKTKTIDLPSCFSQPVREDILSKVLEAKKIRQPYSPSPVAGKQHSASGIIRHRRHVWKTSYGKGISRIPRKIHSNRGDQFHWIGAEVSHTVGGRRAHPPKISLMINHSKINKKEMKIALESAISATANEKFVLRKYKSLENKKIENLPIVVDAKITSLKTKELIPSIKKILGEDLFEVALQKKKIRSGKGKLRGRKHQSNAGLLLVIGKDEIAKTSGIEIKQAGNLGAVDLARGGPGRLTIYTESAIKELGEKLK